MNVANASHFFSHPKQEHTGQLTIISYSLEVNKKNRNLALKRCSVIFGNFTADEIPLQKSEYFTVKYFTGIM